MFRRTLNLGIVAHVDAGKTTLTERLLHAAGVIDEVGSVDEGTTQTDSLPLERRRGITIRAAVVSFPIGDLTVNLIDTPGHPDFIAEVERALSVLDGAILVVSAVEGVQPQTRILMRALKRLGIPTLIFVNKVDRAGAGFARVLAEIAERLTPAVVPLVSVAGEGTREAVVTPRPDDDPALLEALADHDDRLLESFLEDERSVPPRRLRAALAAHSKAATVHPVLCGSALTGAGVEPLTAAIAELLPGAAGDTDGALSGTVFKIERGPGGEKVAYVRLFSGALRPRDPVRTGAGREEKVTELGVFERGGAVRRAAAFAGEIARVRGLRDVRIGDAVGTPPLRAPRREFPPPTLESVVAPLDPGDARRLRIALARLAEQDPLIDVRQDDRRRELSVSLYGEVQKEVVQATLASDFGVDVVFRESTPIHVERPTGSGEAAEGLHAPTNPFNATLAFRVEPAPDGAGVSLRLDVDGRAMPLYVYKTAAAFAQSMDEYVRATLREGLHGWEVTDCVVTLTGCGYSVADGPPSRRGPTSTAADFRKLTPIVLMKALARAGTVPCEPTLRLVLDVPTATLGAVMPALARLGAVVETPRPDGRVSIVTALLSAARTDELRRQLPRLTGGEGVLDTAFAGYRPVSGEPPRRRRTTPSPLNLGEYTMHLARRVAGGAGGA